MTTLKSGDSASFKWYNMFGFGVNRNWLRASLSRPDLAEGCRWLFLIRVGAFPRLDALARRDKAAGLVPYDTNVCRLCQGTTRTGWEWVHLLMRCTWAGAVSAREEFLAGALPFCEEIARARPGMQGLLPDGDGETRPTSVEGVVAIYLVGGVVKGDFDHAAHLGFGALDLSVQDYSFQIWLVTASFLQNVVPGWLVAYGRLPFAPSEGDVSEVAMEAGVSSQLLPREGSDTTDSSAR